MAEITTVAYPPIENALLLSFPFPVPALFSLKAAGEMGPSGASLSPARASLLNRLEVSRDRFVSLHQIHSRMVHVAEPDMYGADGDGMITSDRRLCLGVTVADCMPIFLYDRAGGAFGLLHSGWRGTGIVSDAVRLLSSHFETDPSELTVMMGPCIGPCCYRVDQERAMLFAGRWGEDTVSNREGEWYLDLPRANLNLLQRLGVSRIIDAHVCTSCNTAFSSFRRDGPKQYTGMLALLGRMTVPEGAVRLTAERSR